MNKQHNISVNPKGIDVIYNFIDTIMSFVRILVLTKFVRKTKPIERNNDKCIVMGNGPSLSKSLSDNKEELENYDLIAVNYMGISNEYLQYKPKIYILTDPAFWFDVEKEEIKVKVKKLYDTIAAITDWNLQLYLPYIGRKEEGFEAIYANKKIAVKYYNKTKFEGIKWIKHFIYGLQWGMPRAQNIMVASLMMAIYSKYSQICLFGAENNFIENLWVDGNNCLRRNFYHFYKEDSTENESLNLGKSVFYEQLFYLFIVFKSYLEVANFANKRNIKIYNCTPNSYIDAFERKKML